MNKFVAFISLYCLSLTLGHLPLLLSALSSANVLRKIQILTANLRVHSVCFHDKIWSECSLKLAADLINFPF